MEVSLTEMLDARERRARRQMQLLPPYQTTLICFTMNIAGPVKNSPLIRRGFEMGKTLLRQQLMVFKAPILHFEEIHEKTGNEAIFVLDPKGRSLRPGLSYVRQAAEVPQKRSSSSRPTSSPLR